MEPRVSPGCFPVVLLFVVLLLGFTFTVAAQDITEAETMALPVLQDGDVIEAAFEGSINGHLYVFVGTAGDIVSITMTQPEDSLLDPYLILLSMDGQVLAVDDDSGPVLLSAQIQNYALPEDGIYLVLATTFPGLRFAAHDVQEGGFTEPEPYTLAFSGATGLDEDAEDLDLMLIIGEIGMTEVLTITEEVPVVLIVFAAEAGDVLNIRTTETGNEASPFEFVDTLLYLFDREGNRLAVNDDADLQANDLFAALEGFEVPEDGLYLILATAFNYYNAPLGDWQSGGSFLLTILRQS